MSGIFISYRREDAAGHAGRLFDRLKARFGKSAVFMDVEGIDAGIDFVETIDDAVSTCDVLLAVIGRGWLDARDDHGARRLDNPQDFVRLETGAALSRRIRVIPVLVEGVAMPPADALPEALQALARRQAVELRDSRWEADVENLIQKLEQALAGGAEKPGSAPASPPRSPGRTKDEGFRLPPRSLACGRGNPDPGRHRPGRPVECPGRCGPGPAPGRRGRRSRHRSRYRSHPRRRW
jgi:hypothetical protein